MTRIHLRPAALAFLFALSAVPCAALAFETVDTLPWPSDGRFPAYTADERRPTTLWVQGGVMRDDNILRVEDGEGDTVTRVGVGIRHEQRIIGRQRVVAEARTDYYDFRRFNSLDHAAYSLAGTWNWEVGNNLAGTVVAGREKRLVDLGETAGEATRDFVTLTRLGATGGLLVTPRLRLRGGVAATWGERALRSDIETRAAAWTAGAEYVSPLSNTLGVEYRSAYGDASDRIVAGTAVNDDSREKELALIATYSPGPWLRTTWRLGKTHRSYTQIPGREFKGTTYLMHAEFFPGNKTILALDAYREPRAILDVGASHVLVQGFAFGPSWAATTKLVFSGRLVRERREFQGDPALVLTGSTLRDELLYLWRFGVGWEPARQWQVSAALDHGTRESNLVGRDYDYNAVMLNVAWRY